MKIQTKTIQWNEDEYYDLIFNLEKIWQGTLARYSGAELLNIFPESKEIIPEKLKEYQDERDGLVKTIKKKLAIIKNSGTDDGTQWFWRAWIKVSDGEKLLEIDRHLSRLKRLWWLAQGKSPPKDHITEADIQKAKSVPIENLINGPLRKGGKVLMGLCLFHNERHPSFCVYPATNRWWCYGCNQGGDTINLIKLLHSLNFPQAVKWLNNL